MKSAKTRNKIMCMLLGICALLLVAYGVLIVFVLRGSEEKKRQKEQKEPKETIRVLKAEQYTSSSFEWDGKKYVNQYKTDEVEYQYDSYGRLTKESHFSDGKIRSSYDLEYYYDRDTPVTRVIEIWYTYRNGETQEIDRREEHEYYPSGKIRSHTKFWYSAPQTCAIRTFYDTTRHETEWIRYHYNGDVAEKGRYYRDVNGFEISCEIWTPEDDEWTVAQNTKSECDSEGRVRKQYEYLNGIWRLTREIEYYDDGTWLRTDYAQAHDKKDESKLHTYPYISWLFDREGRRLETKGYDYWSGDEPFVDLQVTYEYTDDGGYTEKKKYNSGAEYITVFDRDSREISLTGTDRDGAVCRVVQNTYSDDGRILKSRSSKDGVEFEETIYCYDQQGNLMFAGSASDEGEGRYYEYDPYGNLLRQWSASDERLGTSYQYEEIRLSKEQLEENKKFYSDDPAKMDRIIEY